MAKKSGKPVKRGDTLAYMLRRYVGTDPERLASLEQERLNAQIAQELYDLRKAAGFTQQQLAELANTTASVISRLESSDYDGHSLSMIRRIATALRHRVEVRFVPQ